MLHATRCTRLQVDITPDISLLTNAGALDYDLDSALCELIDNAIQARRTEMNDAMRRKDSHTVVAVTAARSVTTVAA